MGNAQLSRWLAELQDGDTSCLKTIFEEHAAYCIGLLKRNTNCSQEDAEDILVEAVMNFREKLLAGKIEYLTSLRNYLYTTCHNMYLAQHKKQSKQQEKTNDLQRYFLELMGAEEEAENKEELWKISVQALQSLGDKCKTIIESYYIEGLSMELVAKRLGLANANVAKVSKSRCLKQLVDEAKQLLVEYLRKKDGTF